MALLSSYFHGLLRFTSPYYVVNFMSLVTYMYLRTQVLLYTDEHGARRLEDWEQRTSSLLVIVLIGRFLRSSSPDEFVATAFLFCKASVAFLAYCISPRLLVWYLVLFGVLELTVYQPVYRGPCRYEYLNPMEFDDRVVNEGKDKPKDSWLVCFFASWSPPCVHVEPTFAKLSERFTTQSMRFAKVDVARWPVLAKKHGISTSGVSKQLPTIILFEGGREVARIPHVYPDGRVAKGRFFWSDLVKGFELDMRYARSRGSGGGGGGGGGGADKKNK
ncbi:thioredoxin-related transmembrane protein 2 [Pycnococcus provasolii]